MIKSILFPLLVLLFAGSACSQQIQSTPTQMLSSGVEGHVTEGPMCPGPAPVDNNSCPDKPYQATITILDNNNNQVSKFQTDSVGYFKIELAPGTYILHPESTQTLPHANDLSIVVMENQFTQVSIMYDTGMR